MKYRQLGSTGLMVSEIGFGCSRLGSVRAGASRREELALLGAAADAGITFFDTSDLYSQGECEVLVGKAFRRQRSEVQIATKGGYVVAPGRRVVARMKPYVRPIVQRLGPIRPARPSGPSQPIPQDFSRQHLAAAVEASLRRLGSDYIDVYQLHSPPRSVVERGEALDALLQLRAEGKVRHVGIAADRPEDVVGHEGRPGLASLQVPFSVLEPDAGRALLPSAAERGVGVISRSCFAAGLLRDDVPDDVLQPLGDQAAQILRLRRLAAELGRSLLEVALQFSLATKATSVTLLGMRTPDHLSGNLRLYSAPPLTADERAMLELPRAEPSP